MRRSSDERISRLVEISERVIHRLRDTIGGVPCDVLGNRSAIEAASRLSGPLDQLFRLLEYIVRDRHGCLHTRSITEGLRLEHREHLCVWGPDSGET